MLSALLRQNPQFHAGMSTGLYGLVSTNLNMMSAGTELSLLMEEEQRPRILRALFEAYYADVEDGQVIFDTNRGWCAKMPLVKDLFPQARVIACVRDVPWIMDSLERVIRKNPYETTRLFAGDGDQATVHSRVETLARHDRLVGFGWTALKEAFYGEEGDRLLVIDYEYLARAPEAVLRLVYQFIGEPWFEGHDFENVEYTADDYDAALGIKGLHTVRRKVSFESRPTILPPDLFQKFTDMSFWRDITGSRANVITAKSDPASTPEGAVTAGTGAKGTGTGTEGSNNGSAAA